MKQLLSWLVALTIYAVRRSCRFRLHDDPRAALRAQGVGHVFAGLHAQQIAAIMAAEPGSRMMVSRSADGETIVPSMRLLGHVPIRGSAGTRKGGAVALQSLIKEVRRGHCGILAVDGPRGPRGRVHGGIGMLAKKSGAAVIAVSVVPRQRWIISRTWDRLQVPWPFTRIDVHFSEPMRVEPKETVEAFVQRVEAALRELEWRHDPEEAEHNPEGQQSPSRRSATSESENQAAA